MVQRAAAISPAVLDPTSARARREGRNAAESRSLGGRVGVVQFLVVEARSSHRGGERSGCGDAHIMTELGARAGEGQPGKVSGAAVVAARIHLMPTSTPKATPREPRVA